MVTDVGEESEVNGLPDSLIQYGPSGATEAFTIRVGAFQRCFECQASRRVVATTESGGQDCCAAQMAFTS